MTIADHIAILLQHNIQTAIEDVLGVEHSTAANIADQVFKHLQTTCGGREIYIPVEDKKQRNEKIKQEFNGRNHAEICSQYHISLRLLYCITKKINN